MAELQKYSVRKKAIPCEFDEQELFFYTPTPGDNVEQAVSSCYEDLAAICSSLGCSLVFLPELNKEFNSSEGREKLAYYNPKANLPEGPVEALTYKDLKDLLQIPDSVDGPCFVRFVESHFWKIDFVFIKIEYGTERDIIAALNSILTQYEESPRYSLDEVHPFRKDYMFGPMDELPEAELSIISEPKPIPADETFDIDIQIIEQEIRDRVNQLRAKGITELAIRKLIGDDADKPGKIHIDERHKIYMTDYGNKEIKMEPLQKAVFFLFLKHDEGIYFKDLGDYRKELTDIYKEITGRESIEDIENSIARLTDPFDNSINEKCARIKSAFVSQFRDEVAQWYYIKGEREKKKGISLPRNLVTWDSRTRV